MSNYDGGIRVASIVAGGMVPQSKSGRKYDGLVAVYDWYATFVALAGGSLADPVAEAAGLPPVDAIDLSSAILGIGGGGSAVAERRTELAIGTQDGSESVRNVAGLLMMMPQQQRLFKLLTGLQNQAAHSAPLSPNSTENASLSFSPGSPDEFAVDCGDRGCLFELIADEGEGERREAWPESAKVLQAMHARLREMRASALVVEPGAIDEGACEVALGQYGGFWGPFAHDKPHVGLAEVDPQ